MPFLASQKDLEEPDDAAIVVVWCGTCGTGAVDACQVH